MSFRDLREFVGHLEQAGELVRIGAEVDPDQEITVIQHRVLAAGGPALLFEKVKGSPYRLVSNLFGTPRRVEMAFGRHPGEIGNDLVRFAERMKEPGVRAVWEQRRTLWSIARARMRTVRGGPVLDRASEPPVLTRLPVLKCWPLDGGRFFTLPLVHTMDPETGAGNLGIYRLQLYDDASTGMHWQIEKGGGFHFHKAKEANRPLPVSVILGGPPALTLAAIAPMPEGFDERLLAALIMGAPLDVILRRTTGHRVPARAEFLLEGTVTPGDLRREGPFGDHLGHYSHSADFPVYRVDRIFARNDAIYPATVVGKPPQEDYYIGEALEHLMMPLLKLVKPGVRDVWAYPETGFHPLAVLAVDERYAREGLKQALGLLGEGQMSLSKVMIVVDHDVDVRDFTAVSRAIWAHTDPAEDLHVIGPTAQDTLDFTGPSMNTGSRLIILATRHAAGPRRTQVPAAPTAPRETHPAIRAMAAIGPAFLMVQVSEGCDREAVRAALAGNPVTAGYLFHVLVSPDVPVDDRRMALWGWFTRFDPFLDLHPARREAAGNRLTLHAPIAIDATWKPGYRKPVQFDPAIEKRVEARWNSYGIPV